MRKADPASLHASNTLCASVQDNRPSSSLQPAAFAADTALWRPASNRKGNEACAEMESCRFVKGESHARS